MKTPILVATFVCALGFNSSAQADIYSYTDESGTVHFSNVPDDKRFRVTLRTSSADGVATATARVPSGGFIKTNLKRFSTIVDEAAKMYQLEPALLHAVITAESSYNPNAVSPKGATGLMQLMPATAARYGVSNIFDPNQNIFGGAQYLRYLLQLFNNDMSLAVAAYNAGEHNVMKYGNRIPPFRETINYVPKVLSFYKHYQLKT